MSIYKTINIDLSKRVSVPNDETSFEFYIQKIGRSKHEVDCGPWTRIDPCGHGSYTIVLTKLRNLEADDNLWRFTINGYFGAHVIESVTLDHYCDMDMHQSLSVMYNLEKFKEIIQVFPCRNVFAASWNLYVAFRIRRHCIPVRSV